MPVSLPTRSLPAAVTVALVSGDLRDATDAELSAAAAHVEASIAGMPDAMRLGVRMVSAVAGVVLLVLGRRPFVRQPLPVQQRLLAVLVRIPLPGVAEFVRLTRGLGLVSVFEGRSA